MTVSIRLVRSFSDESGRRFEVREDAIEDARGDSVQLDWRVMDVSETYASQRARLGDAAAPLLARDDRKAGNGRRTPDPPPLRRRTEVSLRRAPLEEAGHLVRPVSRQSDGPAPTSVTGCPAFDYAPGQPNLYLMMRLKQDLVATHGLERGFELVQTEIRPS